VIDSLLGLDGQIDKLKAIIEHTGIRVFAIPYAFGLGGNLFRQIVRLADFQ
jgi:hypothetical protein